MYDQVIELPHTIESQMCIYVYHCGHKIQNGPRATVQETLSYIEREII